MSCAPCFIFTASFVFNRNPGNCLRSRAMCVPSHTHKLTWDLRSCSCIALPRKTDDTRQTLCPLKWKAPRSIDRPTEPGRFSCSGGINNENKGSLPSKETGPQYCTPRIIVSSFFCYSFLVHHLVQRGGILTFRRWDRAFAFVTQTEAFQSEWRAIKTSGPPTTFDFVA